MKKKILITGANGFIGSHLTEEALQHGYKVYAGVRKPSDLTYIKNLPVTFVEMDFSDKEKLRQTMKQYGRFNYIIHNAGITKSCKQETFDEVNYGYTKHFIESLHETNLVPDKFIYMSSLAAIGPGNESTFEPVNNNTEPHPVSHYGAAKLKTERYIRSLNKFPHLIFRPTGVYGPRDKDYLVVFKNIKHGLETYVGTKNQHLTFLFIKDLTRLIIDSLGSRVFNKSYFVSDLKHYTTIEFSAIIKKELNTSAIALVFPELLAKPIAFLNEKLSCIFLRKAPTLNRDKFRELIMKNWLCDSSALVDDFGFEPEFDLEKGIHYTIQWYKNQKLL